MSSRNFRGHARRFARRHGEDVTLHNYSQDGTDEYGDPEFSETTSQAKAVVDFPNQGSVTTDDSGMEIDIVAIMYIPDTETVRDASDAHPKPTEVTLTRTSEKYIVHSAIKDNSGLIQCDCRRFPQ